MSNIAQRLEQKFGVGSRPDLRRALYRRLETICNEADFSTAEKAYHIIASVAADAVGKAKPGNYFASVVSARLREKGILSVPEAVF